MVNMPGDAIRLEAVGKSFSNVTALKDITLQVRAGEILALVGANGAGKTTLLELLATVQLPTSGRATVGGFDLIREAQRIRRVVTYCSAGAEGFYPQLTGRANLEFFAALYGLSPHDAATRTRHVLEMTGALEVGEVVFQRYSTGMKQKVNLARALLAGAPFLLLDEPTRSLDADARLECHALLRRLAGAMRTTVVLVTHDPDEVQAVCDRAALLSGGRIARVWSVDAAASLAPARSAAG